MCELRVKTATIIESGRGTFRFTIDAFDTVDLDGEIIASYANVNGKTATVDVDYGHMAMLGPGADPLAQKIGTASVSRSDKKMVGDARLDMANRVAQMVHERLLLPSDDPAHLGNVSVWFAFDPEKVTTDAEGFRTIHAAELLSVAIIREGAQKTSIDRVKAAFGPPCPNGVCSPADHFRRLQKLNIAGNRRGLPGQATPQSTIAKLAASVSATVAAREVAARLGRKVLLATRATDVNVLEGRRAHEKRMGNTGKVALIDIDLAAAKDRRREASLKSSLDLVAELTEQRVGARPGSLRGKLGKAGPYIPKTATTPADDAKAREEKAREEKVRLIALANKNAADGMPRPIPQLTSRMVEVRPPAPTPADAPERFRLPVVGVDDGRRRIQE